jgi:hypothetical protein
MLCRRLEMLRRGSRYGGICCERTLVRGDLCAAVDREDDGESN